MFFKKLQQSAQKTIESEKPERILTGFFQNFSPFGSSQLFYLFSFFGLIGFFIWFLQPSKNEGEEEVEIDDAEKKSKDSSSINEEEEEQILLENLKKRHVKTDYKKKYPTIYESLEESSLPKQVTIKSVFSEPEPESLLDNIDEKDEEAEIRRLEKKLVKQEHVKSESVEKKESGSQNSLLDLFNVKHVHAIGDHFKNLNEVANAIKTAGLQNSQLIFGIDFTISNLENGLKTFNGRSLHFCDDEIKNPYQKVIEILGKTLECFDVDGRIPAFGFGDSTTKDRKVFSFSVSFLTFKKENAS